MCSSSFIWNKHHQIGDPYIHVSLRKQGRHLTAMVRLMVEEMQHQAVEVSFGNHAQTVGIVQPVIQLGLGHRMRPFRDALVEQLAVFSRV